MIEIDGVIRGLEKPTWGSGDHISEEYFILIDLSTSPDRTTQIKIDRIASAIRRLNRNLATTSTLLLYDSEFADTYDDVVGQLNNINSDIEGVDVLQPLIRDDSRFQGASGSFKWAK
jgi:hypothetical protein